MLYIGFDFSIKKPACTVIDGDNIHYFCWLVDVNEKTINALNLAGVNTFLYKSIKTSKDYSDIMRDSVNNSIGLAELICDTLSPFLTDGNNVFIAQEGFSYNSKGSHTLDLAGYKYILMSILMKYVPLKNMYTYAPITIKKTANCAKKGMGKEDMIEAFKETQQNTKFKNILLHSPHLVTKKVKLLEGVDDIVDSYWVTKTLINDINNI